MIGLPELPMQVHKPGSQPHTGTMTECVVSNAAGQPRKLPFITREFTKVFRGHLQLDLVTTIKPLELLCSFNSLFIHHHPPPQTNIIIQTSNVIHTLTALQQPLL